jgi:hypothetical protein
MVYCLQYMLLVSKTEWVGRSICSDLVLERMLQATPKRIASKIE